MRRRSPCLCLCLFLSLLATWIDVGVAKTVPLIQPGFFFDWNNETAPGPPVPVTTQCERIQIKWGRNGAQGSNPVAPFILQIYTSSDEVPFIVPAGNGPTFNFDVPFAPGTLYQICMFDSKGTPGGCQATYTVIANTTVANPSCQRLTPPSPLAVEATVEMGNGAFSRYGFIPTCTDLSVRPKAGKPPYTMTIAPALHPPYNITSNSMDPITWTVSLSWSFEFYISVVSADGLMWANGPLHAGGFGENDDCLTPNTISRKIARATAAGAGVGSLFAGLILGALLVLFISWKKGQGFNPLRWQRHRFYPFDEEGKPHHSSMTEVSSPSEASSSPRHHSSGSIPRAFVIHHDAGRAPVTIMTDTPTEFVEMPPQYQYRGRPNGTNVPSRSTSLGATVGRGNSNSTSPVSSIPSDSERSVPYTKDRKDPNGSSSSSPVSVDSFSVGTPEASTSSH